MTINGTPRPSVTSPTSVANPTISPTQLPSPAESATTNAADQPTATPTCAASDKKSPDGRCGAQLATPFSKDGIPIVSPKHLVSADFVPSVVNGAGDQFTEETLAAYLTMQKAASAAGVTLEVTSGYRSYAEQATIFATKVKELGLEAASRTNARAGQSEHQLGLSLDLYDGRTLGTGFASTKAGRWLWANSYKYGFIMRYPPGSEDVVGFAYQPWHYRFVGVDVASHFGANSRETLEGYLGVS